MGKVGVPFVRVRIRVRVRVRVRVRLRLRLRLRVQIRYLLLACVGYKGFDGLGHLCAI